MIWQTLKAYWKRITAVAVSGAAVLGMFWTASGYVIQADDWLDEAEVSHVLAQTANTKADKLLEYQQREIEREQREAEQQRAKWLEIWKLCMAGTITDKKLCAEAAAALK